MSIQKITDFTLPREAIIEFQEIWQKKYGGISIEQAEYKAKELLKLYAFSKNNFKLP